jgi:hypothetical protein
MTGLEMKYFVLKPKGKSQYAAASRAAMRRYAKVIASDNPGLAEELHSWAEREFGIAWGGDTESQGRFYQELGNESHK